MRTLFIVVNYNGEAHIEQCLQSILDQPEGDFKIIVIDNNSSDGSPALIESLVERTEKIKLIRNDENRGFTGAVNQGIRQSDSEFIALVNNDAFLETKWLEYMNKAAESHNEAGIFASKMVLTNGRLNSTGHVIYRGFAVVDRGFLDEDRGQYDVAEYVQGACAGAAFYRRDLFDEIGLFDDDYFMFNEDVDLSLRALVNGWKILYVPDAVAYHVHSAAAGGQFSELSVYYNSRNMVWTYLKNVPSPQIWFELPWFLMRNFASILFHILVMRHPRAILKSKYDALKELRRVWKKRRSIQANAAEKQRLVVGGFETNILKKMMRKIFFEPR